MIDQSLFDDLADALVADGEPVSYTAIQALLRERRGKGVSDRDLKMPYADWRRRRRYKKRLALLDMNEDMEEAILNLAELATRIAKGREKDLAASSDVQGMQDTQAALRIAELELQLTEAEDRSHAFQQEIKELRRALATRQEIIEVPRPQNEVAAPIPGRKRGTSAATSRFFWNRIMRELASRMRRQGPMSLEQLLAAIGPDDRTLAAAAFRPIDAFVLEKVLAERTKRERHGLTKLPDGNYGVVRAPRRAAAKTV